MYRVKELDLLGICSMVRYDRFQNKRTKFYIAMRGLLDGPDVASCISEGKGRTEDKELTNNKQRK